MDEPRVITREDIDYWDALHDAETEKGNEKKMAGAQVLAQAEREVIAAAKEWREYASETVLNYSARLRDAVDALNALE